MRKKDPKQLNLDLEGKRERTALKTDNIGPEKQGADIHYFDDARKNRSSISEHKYVRAILDLVSHYK